MSADEYHSCRSGCKTTGVLKELLASQIPSEGKALPYRTELTDAGGPLIVDGNYSGRTKSPLSQVEAHRHLQAYGGKDSIDWLSECIRLVAETASNAEYHFEEDGKRLLTSKSVAAGGDTTKKVPMMLERLFNEPNPHMDWNELVELTLIDWLLVGNAYWVKWQTNDAGQPLAMYRMSPQFVKVVPGKFGPDGYAYKLPGEKDETVFKPEQILHFKAANPHSPYYGLGIVQQGARALDMELALVDTMASYYEKQALPSGVVQSERRVPTQVFNKLKQQLRAFYSGSRNSGQLMVLEAGLKYQTISPTAADALFVEASSWSRDRILAMFRINKALLGIDDGTGSPTKIPDAQRIFDTKTMRPLLNKFQKAVTRGLVDPGWGLDFVIDYEQQIAAEDRLKLAGNIASLPGIKVKEIREIAGLEPSTGDDKIDDLVLNLPSDNGGTGGPGDPTRNGNPDRNLPGEPGRPPNPENTLAFNQPPAVSGGTQARRPSEGKKAMSVDEMIEHVESLARTRVQDVKAAPVLEPEGTTSEFTPPDDLNVDRRDAEVDAVAATLRSDILEAVHTLERGLLDAGEGKADGTIYQRIKKSKAWTTFREKLGEAFQRAHERALSAASIHAGFLGLSADEIDYAHVARQIVYREGGLVQITDNLRDDLMKKVLEAQRKGAGREDVVALIREQMDFWRDGHAETVALTEAVTAYNEGTIRVAEENNLDLYVHDGRDHDEPCVEADGQIWKPEEARARRLEHPRCRRGFTPIPTAVPVA